MGALTYGIAYHFKPSVYPGPPKQFAQAVGFMMTGLATVSKKKKKTKQTINKKKQSTIKKLSTGSLFLLFIIFFPFPFLEDSLLV
jgi:hypothetical protein